MRTRAELACADTPAFAQISNAASRTLDEYALEDGDEDGSDADGSGGELHSDGGEVTAADSADAAERGERGAAPGDHL